jgi:hypothetical protein
VTAWAGLNVYGLRTLRTQEFKIRFYFEKCLLKDGTNNNLQHTTHKTNVSK